MIDLDAIRAMAETRQWARDSDAADAMLALCAEVERLRGEGMCDACAGTGAPVSGRQCGCGGTGRAVDLLRDVREALGRAERDRDQARRAARAELLAEIEAREPATPEDVRVWLLLGAVEDARRAALEEAIAVCHPTDCHCADDVRALLDAPAVSPAPPSASEDT